MDCNGTGHCGHSPCPHEIKTQGRIDEVIQKQGWTEETIKNLTWQFIGEKGLYQELAEYFEKTAQEENAENYDEVDDNCPVCQASHHRMVPLGQLGQLRYVRCRSCGTDYTV